MQNTKSLTLFFTHDVSLDVWAKHGLLDREVKPYLYLARKKNWDIQFFTYGNESDLAYEKIISPIKIIPAYSNNKLPKNKYFRLCLSPILLWRHRALLKDQNIYKSNQFWGAWNVIFAKLLWGGTAIARCGYDLLSFSIHQNHSKLRVYFVKLISMLIYKYADLIVLATLSDKKYAITQFPFLKQKQIHIEPNWIDTDDFFPKNYENKKVDIGYIGRFTKQKNLNLLIDAAKKINASVHLYGGGEEQENLDRACTGSRCRIFPWQKNNKIPSLLNNFKIFVLPSHFEGNPKVLLEAMSCSCAVIATNVPGSKEIINNGVNGILCEPDAEKLAEEISYLLDNSDVRRKLGKNARKFIENNYTLSSFLKREEQRLRMFKS